MKKNKILIILIIFSFIILVSSSVFADPVLRDPGTGTVSTQLRTKLPNLWATASYIVQIIAIACVVFAGLRYMFASSDQRADIKKGIINLVIGAILVFGAITIIQVVATII